MTDECEPTRGSVERADGSVERGPGRAGGERDRDRQRVGEDQRAGHRRGGEVDGRRGGSGGNPEGRLPKSRAGRRADEGDHRGGEVGRGEGNGAAQGCGRVVEEVVETVGVEAAVPQQAERGEQRRQCGHGRHPGDDFAEEDPHLRSGAGRIAGDHPALAVGRVGPRLVQGEHGASGRAVEGDVDGDVEPPAFKGVLGGTRAPDEPAVVDGQAQVDDDLAQAPNMRRRPVDGDQVDNGAGPEK